MRSQKYRPQNASQEASRKTSQSLKRLKRLKEFKNVY